MKKNKNEEIEFLIIDDKKKPNKIKKNKINPLYSVMIILLIGIGIARFYMDKKVEADNKLKQQELLKDIKSHYGKYIKITKDTKIYDNNKKVIGIAYKNTEFELEDLKVDIKTKLFKVKDKNYYLNYKYLTKIENLTTIFSDRYKNYIPFNENIVTKDETNFYDENNNLIIKLNNSFEFVVLVKDKDRYGVEYDNRLYYINKKDVEKIKKVVNNKKDIRENIRVLTYHTIFNTKTEKCTNTVICHPIEQFDEHMKYIHDNNYFTLTMNELEMFLDKKINIPMKSIVITLDDGKYATNAVNIVEKYKVNATYFIIGKRYDVSNIKTSYMNFQSHSYDLHNNYKCPGGEQGGQLLCEDKENILSDLKKSKELLGNDVFAFAYPFFDVNDRAKEILKEAGFRLAFIGQYDTDGYSDFNTDRMMIRRKTIFSSDTVDVLASYLN